MKVAPTKQASDFDDIEAEDSLKTQAKDKDTVTPVDGVVVHYGPRRRYWLELAVLLCLIAFVTVTTVILTKGNEDEETKASVFADPCDVNPCGAEETCSVIQGEAVCVKSKNCDPNPCFDGAPICVGTQDGYECLSACDVAGEDVCHEDETCEDLLAGLGFRCKHLCDEPNPCGPGFICDVDEGSVVCTDVDPCDPNPCEEGAPICVHKDGDFKCAAACGHNPDACKDDIEECVDLTGGRLFGCKHKCDEPHPCNENEICTVSGTGEVACFQRNPCDPNPCHAGAPICLATQGTFKCMAACEANPDDCGPNEVCVSNFDGLSFTCKEPCGKPNPCQEDQICLFNRNTTRFECSFGNPCDPNPCAGAGVCIDLGNGVARCEY